MWSREKIGAAAREIADQLQLIEQVKSLQTAQQELSSALVTLNDRIKNLETDMKVLKSEVKFEALKETQTIVNSVQAHLSEGIKDLEIRLARSEQNQLQHNMIKRFLVEDGKTKS